MNGPTDWKVNGQQLFKDLRSNGGDVLIAIAAGWFLTRGARPIFAVLLPHFIEEFDITLTIGGLIITALMFSYAIGQVPGGVLSDRIGEKRILIVSVTVTIATLILLATSQTISLLFIGTITFGISAALYAPARFTILSGIYSEREGAAIGITMAAGSVGNALLPPIAGALAIYSTWRLGFSFLIPAFIVLIIGLVYAIPSDNTPIKILNQSGNTSQSVLKYMSEKEVMVIILIQILLSFVFSGFVGFYPTYLIRIKNISPSISGFLFSIFFAGAVFMQLISGGLYDRIGKKKTLQIFITGGTISLFVLTFANGIIFLGVLSIALSMLTGIAPVTQTFITNAFPDEIQGTGLGLVRSSSMMLSSFGPLYVGLFADMGYFNEAFLTLGGVGVVGLIACRMIQTVEGVS